MVAAIALDPITGPVGTVVEITGTDFDPNDAITFTFAGSPITADDGPITSDGTGAFIAHITVPAATQGVKAITATDENTNSDSANFTVTPQIILNPTQGPAGTEVTITGTGFAGEEDITTTFDTDPIVTDPAVPTTTASGSFSATLEAPAIVGGAKVVECTDETTNSAQANFTVQTVPDEPVLDTVAAISGTAIELDWTAPAYDGDSPITGYKIEANINSGGWATIVEDTESTDTDYTHTGLSSGDEVSYRISAINAIGTGDPSNVLSDTTWTPPDAPEVSVSIVTGSTALLSWPEPSDGGSPVTDYEIEYADNQWFVNSEIVQIEATDDPQTYQLTDLTEDTHYYVRVRAINDIGNSQWSETTDFITDDVPLTPFPTQGSQVGTIPADELTLEDQDVDAEALTPIMVIDARNYQKTILQMINTTESAVALQYNVYTHANWNNGVPPDFDNTSWIKLITSDVTLNQNATNHLIINDEWAYIIVAAKVASAAAPAKLSIFGRGLTY